MARDTFINIHFAGDIEMWKLVTIWFSSFKHNYCSNSFYSCSNIGVRYFLFEKINWKNLYKKNLKNCINVFVNYGSLIYTIANTSLEWVVGLGEIF